MPEGESGQKKISAPGPPASKIDGPMEQKTHKLALLVVFGLALTLRLVLVFALGWEDRIVDAYDLIANNLINGNGFSYNGTDPTVCRGPAYPFYLSLFFRALPADSATFTIIRGFDSLMDSFTAVVLVLASRRWFPQIAPGAALAAGLLYALNPFMAYYTVKLGSETLSIFFFALYLLVLYPAFVGRETARRPAWIAAAGVLGGILILNKSVFLPLVVLVPVVLTAVFPRLRTAAFWKQTTAAVCLSLVIVTPWSVRNSMIAGAFVPTQTLTGFNFWYDFSQDTHRNNAVKSGDWNRTFRGDTVERPDGTPYHPYQLHTADDVRIDRQQISAALAWSLHHPGGFAVKVLDNLLAFWYQTETPAKMLASGIFSLLLLVLAVLGVILSRSAGLSGEALFFLLLILFFNLIYAPIMGVFRYSLVTYPMLSLLGGVTLSRLTGRAGVRVYGERAAGQ